MKKVLGISMSFVLLVMMSLPVLGAPSPGRPGTIIDVDKAVDADGNTVNIIVKPIPEGERPKNPSKDGMHVVDVIEISSSDNVKFPVTITFKVPGVTSGSKVSVFIYDEATGEWKEITATAGDGTITATFDSFGKVAFLVGDSSGKSTGTGKVSPKTGEAGVNIWFAWLAVFALAGGAGALYRWKRIGE